MIVQSTSDQRSWKVLWAKRMGSPSEGVDERLTNKWIIQFGSYICMETSWKICIEILLEKGTVLCLSHSKWLMFTWQSLPSLCPILSYYVFLSIGCSNFLSPTITSGPELKRCLVGSLIPLRNIKDTSTQEQIFSNPSPLF